MLPTKPFLLFLPCINLGWALDLDLGSFGSQQAAPLLLGGDQDQPLTPIHEPNMCAIYGQCGKKSLFGKELPCVANVAPAIPNDEELSFLTDICGEAWNNTPVCCNSDQLSTLKTNLKKAENLISSCPACQENFFQFFCRFTCSPNQSEFVNITSSTQSMQKKEVVTELSYYVDPIFASGFYDSCKDVKFGATNGYAMDLIGGGAKDYKAFLKFLGDEKPLFGGSPFQINFPWNETTQPDDIKRSGGIIRNCSDSDPKYRCACSDCPDSCPSLKPVKVIETCKVGAIPCFSFSVIIIYSGCLFIYLLSYSAILLWKRYKTRKAQRIRLLEEDEDDVESIDDINYSAKNLNTYVLNNLLENWFGKLAFFCSSSPKIVIFLALIFVSILSFGVKYLQLETNPIRLWVSPNDPSFKEKQFYDENFGPFYRAEQVFVVNETGPVMNYDNLKWWFEKEKQLKSLITEENGISLSDICLAPTGSDCVIHSFTQYFNDEISTFPEKNWESLLQNCVNHPVNCLPPFQQPLSKLYLFGGEEEEGNVLSSKALFTTFIIQNHLEEDIKEIAITEEWEQLLKHTLLDLQLEAKERGLRLSFTTEISLEEELNKSSNSDGKIIAISYLFMFIYASLALGGGIPKFDVRSLIDIKFSLGLAGIIIVLLSVISSVGLFSYLGVKATLIIAEVIPFLVLAVGVDNIFLLRHELQIVNSVYSTDTVPERIKRAVSRIAPSIVLSALSEAMCFSLGAVVSMPAVRNFAIYSAGAVIINAILQLTVFISVLSLDQQRVDSGRIDVLFIKVKNEGFLNGYESAIENQTKSHESIFNKLIKKYYAPILLNSKFNKKIVLSFFILWFGMSLTLIPKIELGLDQRIAVPNDSYLIDYFNDLSDYYNVGAPLYFIVSDIDVRNRTSQQALCGRFSTCNEFSLINQLEQERKRPEVSYIAEPTTSWLDDFLTWLNPSLEECCRFKKGTNETETCPSNFPPRRCDVCFEDKTWKPNMDGFPEGDEFMRYFDIWINSPSDPCPLGGKAPYSSEIITYPPNDDDYNVIKASKFRTSHLKLVTNDDYTNSIAASKRISKELEDATGAKVFAYSPFYIYFVQYLTIVSLTFTLLGTAVGTIWVISSVLLGSIRSGTILIITVIMILVDIAGLMALWNVTLNAVSLVNLVICVGIAVEFCTHVTRGFTVSDKFDLSGNTLNTINSRAFSTLVGVGGSVFGGIALTKLIGVTVLAFTKSKIFEVYYFRMWAALVLVSTLHSLAFLPVVLSMFGGHGYVYDSNVAVSSFEENIAARLINRSNDRGDYDSDDDEE